MGRRKNDNSAGARNLADLSRKLGHHGCTDYELSKLRPNDLARFNEHIESLTPQMLPQAAREVALARLSNTLAARATS